MTKRHFIITDGAGKKVVGSGCRNLPIWGKDIVSELLLGAQDIGEVLRLPGMNLGAGVHRLRIWFSAEWDANVDLFVEAMGSVEAFPASAQYRVVQFTFKPATVTDVVDLLI